MFFSSRNFYSFLVLLLVGTAGCDLTKKYENSSINKLFDADKKPHNNLLQILEASSLEHDGSLASIVEKTQKAWIRPAGVERFQMKDTFSEQREKLVPYFKAIGLINEVRPSKKHYKYCLVLGGNINGVRDRLAYAVTLWNDSIRFDQLVFLTGARYLDPVIESVEALEGKQQTILPVRSDWLMDKSHMPTTETDIMRLLYEQAILPEGFKKIPLTVIDVPQQKKDDGTFRRPNTEDTFRYWLASKPEKGDVVSISCQPHVGYQDNVARNLLPDDWYLETVGSGVSAESVSVAVCFDALARWIYQENKIIQKKATMENKTYALGLRELQFVDTGRIFDNQPRTLDVAVWYPVDPSTQTKVYDRGIWKTRGVALNTPIVNSGKKYPLVMFSHGYSGDQWSCSWFAELLASEGYIVACPRHYGNTWGNMIPEICARPWNRPQDLSFVLDHVLEHPEFRDHIDHNRIGAAGFSQGGITAMWLSGVCAHMTSDHLNKQITYINDPYMRQLFYKNIPQERLDRVLADFSTVDFDQANQSYRDPRVKAAYAIAPGIDDKNYMFSSEGLSKSKTQTHIIVGQAEEPEYLEDNRMYAQLMPSCSFSIIPGHVRHLTLLNEGTEDAQRNYPEYTTDHSSVSRASVHKSVAEDAIKFFNRTLG